MKKEKNLIKVSLFILLSLSMIFAREDNSFLYACQEKSLNDTPKLTVHERAFSVILLHEGTDYDCTEWNYGTGDDKSALTWGPYGATVGWKNEVRGILKIIHNNNPELLMKTFDKEFPAVLNFIKSDPDKGYKLIKKVWADRKRRQIWKKSLESLGGTKQGRNAYDSYAFDSEDWLRPNLRKLYSLIPGADSKATEIDYAFFLDLGVHASISSKRIRAVQRIIRSKEKKMKRPLSAFERRRIIGQFFAGKVRRKRDRMGRNVVFYIDGFGKKRLSAKEINTWKKRSGRKASGFGLSDCRNYYPGFLK